MAVTICENTSQTLSNSVNFYADISIAKGLCILLMVFAHAENGTLPYLHNFIYTFHMPLFFVVAGFCFKEKYLFSANQFFLRRIKGLWWPYVKYGALFLFLHNFFLYLHFYEGNPYSIKDILYRLFHLATGMFGHEDLLGGFWFLKDLLFSPIMGFFIIKYLKNKFYIWLLLLAVGTLFIFYNYHIPYIDVRGRTFMGMFFFVTGYALSKQKKALLNNSIVLVATIFLLLLCAVFMPPAQMLKIEYWQVTPYCLCALLGSNMVIYLGSLIARKSKFLTKMLCFVGENTMPILTYHFLLFKVVTAFRVYIGNVDISDLSVFPVVKESFNIWTIVYFLLGSVIPLLCVKIFYFFKRVCSQ